ncbi:MAG: zf-HC2 domain-containing protein [Candidatus Melainabacteria bacterium]|jgi:hypothetical protein|nr:zf-HC2 domain-containing protein [Candidatus Melainabacteria bacterium]
MKCERVISLLDPLLDNELATEAAASVMEHLNQCPNCQDSWDELMSLRRQFQEFANELHVPSDAIKRLDRRLRSEEKKGSIFRFFGSGRVAVAAVFFVIAGLLVYQLRSPDQTRQIQSHSREHVPALVGELTTNYLEVSQRDTTGDVDTEFQEVVDEVEFNVSKLSFHGWELTSAKVLHLPKSACIVRLTYQAKINGKKEKLICYQSCQGNIKPFGLTAHSVDGRQVCCGKMDGLSLVFWPSDGRDHVLIGTLPEKELMLLALGV